MSDIGSLICIYNGVRRRGLEDETAAEADVLGGSRHTGSRATRRILSERSLTA